MHFSIIGQKENFFKRVYIFFNIFYDEKKRVKGKCTLRKIFRKDSAFKVAFQEKECYILFHRIRHVKKGESPVKIFYLEADEPGKMLLKSQDYDVSTLKEDEVLLKNEYSAVSAGTERAWLSGASNNAAQVFPYRPGYSAAGHVLACGSAVKNLKEGDRVVISAGGHRSATVQKASRVFKIEDNSIDLKEAAFSYIASFSLLGLRRLNLQLGESLMIAGQGILGLIAVQFASYCGANPLLAADPDPARRELALQLGADAALDPAKDDFVQQVKNLTGNGVNAVVEVTGIAAALKQALQYTARQGRITLLGCTRVPDQTIDFYREVHLPGITLIGAHTSNRPYMDSRPGQWSEHDDYRTLMRFLANRKVQITPLISRVASPEEAPEVYKSLLAVKNPPPGILFDWRDL